MVKYTSAHWFYDFCEKIGLQQEVIKCVSEIYEQIDRKKYGRFIAGLCEQENALTNYLKLLKKIGEDPCHWKMLALQLGAVRQCQKKYCRMGIDNKIFEDTMKCFPRFLQEHYQKCGKYEFDRSWWTYRQLNMSIFRLGELEFEFESTEKINIHIPSDAILKMPNVLASLEQCRRFSEKHFTGYTNAKLTCCSWLLSPRLAPLLSKKSNILQFQKLFNITQFFAEDKQFIGWLFQTEENTPIEQYKEETSLQRKVKKLLKDNISIGSAYGEIDLNIIRKDYGY